MLLFTKRLTRASAILMAAAAGLFAHSLVQAQAYPSRPVHLVVPAAAGGPTDVMSRLMGEKLSAQWGQSVVIDNRPGGNSIIGAQIVAKAPPDGYTLLAALDSILTMHQYLYAKLPYDPTRDFVPVAMFVRGPLVLLTDSAKGPKNVKELFDQIKAGGAGKVTIGVGTLITQLGAELIKLRFGLNNLTVVPYNGSAPTTQGLLSNDVTFTMDVVTAALPHLKSGRFRVLANMSPVPIEALPAAPSFASETGVSGVEVNSWAGYVAPAGVAPEIVTKLNTDIMRALAQPDVKERVAGFGLVAGSGTAAEFAAYVRSESEKWGQVIKQSGFKVE